MQRAYGGAEKTKKVKLQSLKRHELLFMLGREASVASEFHKSMWRSGDKTEYGEENLVDIILQVRLHCSRNRRV